MSTAPFVSAPTFMTTGLPLFSHLPYRVADWSEEANRFGRKELELALVEMPGLRSVRSLPASVLLRVHASWALCT